MKEPRLSKAETRILEQCWKLGTASVREVLESLPEDERVAYTTVQTLVYRLEEKGALKKVNKIGNAQLFRPALDQSQYRSRLVRALWFHPLIWLAGMRMALYRELSCDESVIQRAQGQALVRALAKLAVPEA